MMARYAEKLHIVPVFSPAGTTTFLSYAVGLKNSHWVTFLINLGVMTSDSSDVGVVTVIATDTLGNTTDAEDVAVPFTYRLSGIMGTNEDWGDITAATASGMTFNATDDGKSIVIDVDPASIPALHSTAKGVRIAVDGTGLISQDGIAVNALVEDRYPQADHISATT
jgi:hypothetical protein